MASCVCSIHNAFLRHSQLLRASSMIVGTISEAKRHVSRAFWHPHWSSSAGMPLSVCFATATHANRSSADIPEVATKVRQAMSSAVPALAVAGVNRLSASERLVAGIEGCESCC